jgi:hypothetical protein
MSAQQFPEPHEREAARRYLEHDYASRSLGGTAGREANRNAQAIDEEHPRARDIAMTGTERELGKLPKHLREHQAWSRQRAGITSEHAARIRREYRAGPYQEPDQPDEPPAAPAAPARQGARSAAGAALGRAGGLASTAADTSWGQLVGEFFLWGALLSIGYLLITKAAATGKLFQGGATAVRAVVSPVVDPLNPKGAF